MSTSSSPGARAPRCGCAPERWCAWTRTARCTTSPRRRRPSTDAVATAVPRARRVRRPGAERAGPGWRLGAPARLVTARRVERRRAPVGDRAARPRRVYGGLLVRTAHDHRRGRLDQAALTWVRRLRLRPPGPRSVPRLPRVARRTHVGRRKSCVQFGRRASGRSLARMDPRSRLVMKGASHGEPWPAQASVARFTIQPLKVRPGKVCRSDPPASRTSTNCADPCNG